MPNDIHNDPETDAFRAFEPFPPYEGDSDWPNPGPWLLEKIRGLMGARGADSGEGSLTRHRKS
jgi:hypothetical protein